MAFVSLKKAFTSTPNLAHYDPKIPFIMEAGVLDFAFSSTLSQQGDYEKLYPMAFDSRKFDFAEINHKIQD